MVGVANYLKINVHWGVSGERAGGWSVIFDGGVGCRGVAMGCGWEEVRLWRVNFDLGGVAAAGVKCACNGCAPANGVAMG